MPGACHGTGPIVCAAITDIPTYSEPGCMCTAVDIGLSFITLEEGAGKCIFRHADTSLVGQRGSAVHFKEARS